MAIPTELTFYQANDQVLRITELHNGLDADDFFISAAVTATLRDRSGTAVPEVDGLVLDYVPDPGGDPDWLEGTYQGEIQDTFAAPTGGGYECQITAIQGSTVGNWFIKSKVAVRRS